MNERATLLLPNEILIKKCWNAIRKPETIYSALFHKEKTFLSYFSSIHI